MVVGGFEKGKEPSISIQSVWSQLPVLQSLPVPSAPEYYQQLSQGFTSPVKGYRPEGSGSNPGHRDSQPHH